MDETKEEQNQAVREALELGWNYAEIRQGIGASTSTIADVKRSMGLIPLIRHRATDDALAAAKELVLARRPYGEIREATGVPVHAIKALRRAAGLIKPRRPRPPLTAEAVAAIREALSMGVSYAEIRTQYRVGSDVVSAASA